MNRIQWFFIIYILGGGIFIPGFTTIIICLIYMIFMLPKMQKEINE